MKSAVVAGVYASRRIARFENHPAMPALLKELPPQAVANLFQEIGIHDATVLMAMMPTRALLLAFDESIWKSQRPGMPETIGLRELVDWLIAWSDIGEEFLVDKLQAMNEDYLGTVLSRVVEVESASRYAVYAEDPEVFVKLCDDDRERIGPYIVQAAVEEDGDVVIAAVRALWLSDAQKMLRVLGRLSDLPNPDDSTRGSVPTLHDLEFERESQRQARGFVTAHGARAFFAFAERLTVVEIIALDSYDPETRRYLDEIARASESLAAAPSPIVADEFEDEQGPSVESDQSDTETIPPDSLSDEPNTASLRKLLEDSQLLAAKTPLPLLRDMRSSNEPALTVALRRLAGEDVERFYARARELAYLANVLRWVPSSDVDSLGDDDAKEAAFAICNLGLELASSAHAGELDREPGLVRLFLLGWNALCSTRDRVMGAFAGALSQNSTLAPWLQSEATAGLKDLRLAVEQRRFAEAREAAVFLSIVFDSGVCRAIAPLLDAIPRFSLQWEDTAGSERSRWIATKADLQLLERILDSVRLKSASSRRNNEPAR